jgi:hypothetical protein
LLDENLPVALKPLLLGHDVKTVRDMGWIGIVNGTLLRLAEDAGFQAMVTADKNMAYQNAMAGRRIAWSSCPPASGKPSGMAAHVFWQLWRRSRLAPIRRLR